MPTKITYHPIVLLQVESERQNKALLNYWEEIIHERKNVSTVLHDMYLILYMTVKRTHINRSLDILNEVGRYNKEEIILEGLSIPFLNSKGEMLYSPPLLRRWIKSALHIS